MKKEDVTIEGVNLNIKHLQGLSQADFAEKMNGGGYKHLWADSENRDAIVAEAYAQINPAGTASEAQAEATQTETPAADATETTDAPKGRKRS